MIGDRSRRSRAALIPALAILSCAAAALADEGPAPDYDPKLYQALEYRNIGPYRGGRVTAVSGVAGEVDTYYMGSTGGGVWKTTDGGVTWTNVSDEAFKSASVGAIAIAESDTNVVYAGMGSACVRGNTSPGNGVYRSTDAGRTWKHIGLEDAGQIGRIRVHPTDPDRAYVAAVGHAFGPGKQRGVFRTTDGGKSWDKVLFVGDEVGAVDLAMSPHNPRILFAATWRVERRPWTLISGGEGSGLHRSTDGGETWEELTEGLPEGTKGKIGVSVSGAAPDRVYALIEAEDGGLFRSDDGGKSFRLINSDRNFRQRAWYYTHVYADTRDANTVYVLNVGLWRSDDGGKNFTYLRAPHGDHHDLWINPDDPRILINGNDGGANISYNGGLSWSPQDNQPTAEMYRVTVDDGFPYRVYGCQQDNSCVSLPGRTGSSGIARQDWHVIGGCESGHVAVDPRNTNITYSGCYGGTISRHDEATGQEREIMAYPQLAVGQAPRDLKYRFQWNAPIRISPHDPDVLYHASQYVHRTTDQGQTWEIISPDLTRNDPEKQDFAGEPITRDNTGVEVYGTIFAFEESPQERGALWAGSDDGRVHLSRDGGGTWNEITPKKMPEWGQVNMIELSAHDPGRAFLAVTRYKFDDFSPFIFRTDDHGATWKLLTSGRNGIPKDHFVRVVREDPVRRGLLYAGTEFGLYVSFDDGERWQPLQLNLPVTPVTDLAIKRDDLVVATQGRSFWILDDLTPLRALSPEIAAAPMHLFKPRDTVRFGGGSPFGSGSGQGKNPPSGVMIHYTLAAEPEENQELVLEILDSNGEVLRKLSSREEERRAPNAFARYLPPGFGGDRKLPAKEGMNRTVWDFRLPDAGLVDDAVLWGIARGPRVPPGRYGIRLTLGETVLKQDVEIAIDPRLHVSRQDLQHQFELSRRIWESLSESHTLLEMVRDVRKQVDDLTRRLEKAGKGDGLEEAAGTLKEKLESIETAIHQIKAESGQDVLNFTPGLDNQLLALMGIVESADTRPTEGSVQRFHELRSELEGHLDAMARVIAGELAAFNDLVDEKKVPPVIVPPAD